MSDPIEEYILKNHKCEGFIREKTPINPAEAPKKRV